MRLLLCFSFCIVLALAAESPQRWRVPYSSKGQKSCSPTDPVLVEESGRLAAEGRANGDPCLSGSHCASGYCICGKRGGLECAPAPHCPEAPPVGEASCYLSSNVTCTYGRTCCCGVCTPSSTWVCSKSGIWVGSESQTSCPGCEVSSCPVTPFKHGTRCDADLYCEYGSCSCPGSAGMARTIARCHEGYWSVVTNPQCSCGDICPQAPPAQGSKCTKADQDCSYGEFCCCPPCSPSETVPAYIAYCTAYDDGSLEWDVTNMKAVIQCPSVCDDCTTRRYRYEVDPTTNSFNGGSSDGHRALNTGMYIEEGSNLEIRVSASAKWGIGFGQLVPATGGSETYSWPGPPSVEFPVGALVARIGSRGSWFLAANYRGHASTQGVLELMQWEKDSDDNGHDRLTVEVSSNPASCDPCFGIFCTLSLPVCPPGTKLFTWIKPGECCPSHGCVPLNPEVCPAVRPNIGDHCPQDGLRCSYDAMCCCGNMAANDCQYTAHAVCDNGEWRLALALIRCVPEQCAVTPPDPCAGVLCPIGLALCASGKRPITYKEPGECCAKRGCLPTNPDACPATLPEPGTSCSGELHCAYDPHCCCGNYRDGDCQYTSFAECNGGQWQIMSALVMCPPDGCSAPPPDPCAGIECPIGVALCLPDHVPISIKVPGECCPKQGCLPKNPDACPATLPGPGACSGDLSCAYTPHCCCGDYHDGDCSYTEFAECTNGQWQVLAALVACPPNACGGGNPVCNIACLSAPPECGAGEKLYSYRKPGACCDSFGCISENPAYCPADQPAGDTCNWEGVCNYEPFCCCGNGRPGDCQYLTGAHCSAGSLGITSASILCPDCDNPCAGIACARPIPNCVSGTHLRTYREPGDCCDRYECVPDTPINCPAELPGDGSCNWEGVCFYNEHCCCNNGAPDDCSFITHAHCDNGELHIAIADRFCPPSCNDPCAGIACARPVPACGANERLRTYRLPGDCCARYECVPALPANCPNEIPSDGTCNWDGVCLYNKFCCCNNGAPGDCMFINHAACDDGHLGLAIADPYCLPEHCAH